jgi:hypothetical protein
MPEQILGKKVVTSCMVESSFAQHTESRNRPLRGIQFRTVNGGSWQSAVPRVTRGRTRPFDLKWTFPPTAADPLAS